jgi:ribosomal protein S18 acetylase RimI-like enzyme
MTHLTFVLATTDAVNAVVKMTQAYYAECGYPFDENRVAIALKLFVADPSLGWLWLMRLDGETIGYLAVTLGFSIEYRGRDAFIDEVYVLPDHRGKGFGTQATEFALNRCREAEVNAVHLEVERNNQAAREIYRYLGFTEHDRILMTRWLT